MTTYAFACHKRKSTLHYMYVRSCWRHERVKSMRTTCSVTYWKHRARCISQFRGATEVARENLQWTFGINVGRSTGNPFTFRTPPGYFAGTFSRENDERDGKLRKDNGSCPIELPSVRGTSTSVESKRRERHSEVQRSEKVRVVRTKDLWPGIS